MRFELLASLLAAASVTAGAFLENGDYFVKSLLQPDEAGIGQNASEEAPPTIIGSSLNDVENRWTVIRLHNDEYVLSNNGTFVVPGEIEEKVVVAQPALTEGVSWLIKENPSAEGTYIVFTRFVNGLQSEVYGWKFNTTNPFGIQGVVTLEKGSENLEDAYNDNYQLFEFNRVFID